jgi:hypothetical protein
MVKGLQGCQNLQNIGKSPKKTIKNSPLCSIGLHLHVYTFVQEKNVPPVEPDVKQTFIPRTKVMTIVLIMVGGMTFTVLMSIRA